MVSTDPARMGPPERPPGPFERHWLAIVLSAAFAAIVLTAVALPGPYPRIAGVRLAVAIVACVPMLLLRRWPLPVLAVAVVGSALVITSGTAPLPLTVLLGLATYFVASRLPRRLSIPAAVAGGIAIGGAVVYAAVATSHEGIGALVILGILPLAGAWFVGDAVAARRQYQAGLAEQAAREQAAEAERARLKVREERLRIAQEVHDVVAHTLAVITVQAGVGRRLMAKRPEEAASALESIETIGRTAQEELRVVLGLLREEGISAELSPAPRLADVKELVDTVRASGTAVDLTMAGTDRRLSPALELSLYRVIQEALTNVVKHAPGARATVEVVAAGRTIRVEVADDGGPGSAPPSSEPAQGHGIAGMRERVAAFGGSLTAGPSPAGGFRVVAQAPIEEC